MASSYPKSRLSSALDWGVAALAAASAGFLLFAMPEPLFASLVVKSGLPNVLEAAQPPLGGTARLAAAAAASLFAFGFVLSLLRALDRGPASAPVEACETDAVGDLHPSEMPRLRKADAHPDAPARRPILAGRELGEPVDSIPDELLLEAPEPERAPEPASLRQPLPPFLVPQETPAEAEAAFEPEQEPDLEPEPEPESEPEEDAEAEAEADAQPAADLSSLMERFESGLVRKQQAIVRPLDSPRPTPPAAEAAPAEAAPAAVAAPAPEEPADRVGHRLRSAIADLQKVAGQGR
jgi:hypothetical protein